MDFTPDQIKNLLGMGSSGAIIFLLSIALKVVYGRLKDTEKLVNDERVKREEMIIEATKTSALILEYHRSRTETVNTMLDTLRRIEHEVTK